MSIKLTAAVVVFDPDASVGADSHVPIQLQQLVRKCDVLIISVSLYVGESERSTLETAVIVVCMSFNIGCYV